MNVVALASLGIERNASVLPKVMPAVGVSPGACLAMFRRVGARRRAGNKKQYKIMEKTCKQMIAYFISDARQLYLFREGIWTIDFSTFRHQHDLKSTFGNKIYDSEAYAPISTLFRQNQPLVSTTLKKPIANTVSARPGASRSPQLGVALTIFSALARCSV
jgi:hypothetical protein